MKNRSFRLNEIIERGSFVHKKLRFVSFYWCFFIKSNSFEFVNDYSFYTILFMKLLLSILFLFTTLFCSNMLMSQCISSNYDQTIIFNAEIQQNIFVDPDTYDEVVINVPGTMDINFVGCQIALTDELNNVIDFGTNNITHLFSSTGTYRLHFFDEFACTANELGGSVSIDFECSTLDFDGLFVEDRDLNDGSTNPNKTYVISHNRYGGEMFNGTDGEDFISSTKANVSNIPSGLTGALIKSNDSTLTLSLSGSADNHENADDISNISIQFSDNAFVNYTALETVNSTITGLEIEFIEEYSVGSTGDFTTIAGAVAGVDRFDILILDAETFVENSIVIDKTLRIIGAGPKHTIIKADNNYDAANSRIFTVNSNLEQIEFSGLTLKNARYAWGGGGITSSSPTKIVNCIFEDNITDPFGNTSTMGAAALRLFVGPHIVKNCLFSNNFARSSVNGNNGGAASISGEIILENCTFYNNGIESNDDGYKYGGALSLSGSGVNNVIRNCTFTENYIEDFGAGTKRGGAVSVVPSSSGSITIENTIIYNNDASEGGDFYNFGPVGSILNVRNTIYGDASALNGVNITGFDTDNSNADPLLGVLEDNDGASNTVAISIGSPAIDAGYNVDAPNEDQRGFVRDDGLTDIGAYEFGACGGPENTTDTITACDSYTWIDGVTYTLSNNSATQSLLNVDGCDSIVTLNLTIFDPVDQTPTATPEVFCESGSSVIALTNSEVGVHYSLRDDQDNSVVDGPVFGTRSDISFNTGTINVTTTYNVFAERANSAALTFTGNTGLEKVSLGTSIWDAEFAGNDQLTVEAWVNRSASGSLHTIMSNYQELSQGYPFLFRIDNNKVRLFVNSSAYVESTTDIPVGTWTHVAATYDGANLKIFVNGVEENTVAFSDPLVVSNDEMKIGGGLVSNAEYFPGDIGEVRLWNVARTESEISASYNEQLTGDENGLLIYYMFNEGSGITAYNAAANNMYDGTLINNPSWTTGPVVNAWNCSHEMTQNTTVLVNEPSAGTDVINECNSFEWIDGVTYTENNNTAMYTLTNVDGCDSIVSLDLTINTINTGISVDELTITADIQGADYQWVDCDNGNAEINGEMGQSFTVSSNGNYAVIITENGCSEISACTAITTVGLSNNIKDDYSVYPNPTAERIIIERGNSSMVNYIITDQLGKVVKKGTLSLKKQNIDVSFLTKGIYVLKFNGNNQKFIKE